MFTDNPDTCFFRKTDAFNGDIYVNYFHYNDNGECNYHICVYFYVPEQFNNKLCNKPDDMMIEYNFKKYVSYSDHIAICDGNCRLDFVLALKGPENISARPNSLSTLLHNTLNNGKPLDCGVFVTRYAEDYNIKLKITHPCLQNVH